MPTGDESLKKALAEQQQERLETELADRLEQHPDAKIIRSLPGLGMTLGAHGCLRHGTLCRTLDFDRFTITDWVEPVSAP